jgi:hypothetical protein
MMAEDKTAWICDLAETYGVLNYRELPVETLAALSVGLRENSRIKQKLSGAIVETNTLLMAAAVDRLTFIAWCKTKDAEKGRNKPRSIVEVITGKKVESDIMSFDTAEEFEAARMAIIGRK